MIAPALVENEGLPPRWAVPLPIPSAIPHSIPEVYLKRLYDAVANVRVGFIIVTKEMAQVILEKCNSHNRPMSTQWRKAATALRRLGWTINGETIAFDRLGRLVDGQHRLQAVVSTGIPLISIAVWMLAEDSFRTTGTGKVRNAADVLGIGGFQNTSNLAAALTWQFAWDSNSMDASRPSIPNDQVIEYAQGNPDLVAATKLVCNKYAKKCRQLIPCGLAIFLYSLFGSRSQELTERFFDRVVLGIEVPEDSWEYALRERLERQRPDLAVSNRTAAQLKRDKKAEKIEPVEVAALCVKAFNKSRANAPRPKSGGLKWSATEQFPMLDD